MKKTIYTSIGILLAMSLPISTFAYQCDQSFYDTLRVGYSYNFGDVYNNTQSFRHNIAGGSVTIDETQVGDLNRGSGPGFAWTPEIYAQDYEVAPGQSIKVFASSSPYLVYDYPTDRNKQLLVLYSMQIQGQQPNGSWNAPVTHNECQYYTITRCGDGIIDAGYETCDDGAQNGTAGKCNMSCNATIPPNDPDPVCNSSINGKTVTHPVTMGHCDVGTASGFFSSLNGAITNYSWSCVSGTKSVACTANYGPACGDGSRNGTEICDPNDPNKVGWGANGCDTSCTPINLAPVCNPAKIGTQITPVNSTDNLCTTGTPSGFVPSGTNPIQYAWTCNNASQSVACTANYTPSNTGSGVFDLSLKKYIISGTGSVDAQPGSPLSVNTGDRISYLISVTNSGPQASSGVTTVQDILPVGVTASGSATGVGWSCAYSGVTLTCTSSQVVGSGASYPLITVPVIVTATAGQSVTNIAAVDNPNETNRCNTDGSMPVGAGASCNKDPNNSDPAVITIPGGGGGGGGGGGASHVGASCVNSIKTCALYNSITACEAVAGVGNCDSADAPGQARCAAKTLTCSGPGGPTPGSSTNPNGRCGDGVLGSSPGEECDLGSLNSDTPGSACSISCKVLGVTNPGANPIMDLWMTIPVLAGTKHLGYTWLDGTPGKVPFSDYRMVLGVGTKAFTLADTVGFGIRTQFQIPIMIEESKKICITSTGSSLSPQTLCTTFGEAVVGQSGIHRFQRFDGTTYVVLGNGDYQYQTGATFPYQQVHLNGNSNNINLFRGATQYTPLGGINLGPTLNSAFFGAQVGNDGVISLVACTGTNCAPTATVELVKFDVRVSSAMVSSIGSSSNRSIESFVNMSNPFTGFLGTTSMNTSTTGSNRNNSTNTSVNLPTIVGTTGNQSSSGVTDLERFSVNGNRNILAISGSLTIENCPNNTFEMKGVRTVVVTGDLVIKCNIGYGTNNDASWAWITKNGNIKVYNGTGTPNVGAVTNLAGVFVAVKDSVGGDITYTGSNTTQAILRIEGSLYGDATPLFNSRLYGRATGAYDILTTGTVISYSNRALVSPPPLLSQYLGAYSVQRVVQ